MEKDYLYIKECECEFIKLLNLETFPTYEIIYKDITLDDTAEREYDALAAVDYDYRTGQHTLIVWSGIHVLGEIGKPTLFHEFTHILDDETHVNNDPQKYLANHGYTEYHASQIGFLKALGVHDINQSISFSMNDILRSEPEDLIIQAYVDEPLILTNRLISRTDFPADVTMFKAAMSVIFNYFGRRSICKMYSRDYQDNADTSVIAQLLTTSMTHYFKELLVTWLTDSEIAILDNFYKDVFLNAAKMYKII